MTTFLRTSHGELGMIYCAHRPKNTHIHISYSTSIVATFVSCSFIVASLILSMYFFFFNIHKYSFLLLKFFWHPIVFLLLYFLYFHRTLNHANQGLAVTPLFLATTIVCLITHWFLHWFQPNLCQCLSYVCSTSQTIFRLKWTSWPTWE